MNFLVQCTVKTEYNSSGCVYVYVNHVNLKIRIKIQNLEMRISDGKSFHCVKYWHVCIINDWLFVSYRLKWVNSHCRKWSSVSSWNSKEGDNLS